MGLNIRLRIRFSKTHNLHSSFNVRDDVSQPYSTTGNIIVLYTRHIYIYIYIYLFIYLTVRRCLQIVKLSSSRLDNLLLSVVDRPVWSVQRIYFKHLRSQFFFFYLDLNKEGSVCSLEPCTVFWSCGRLVPISHVNSSSRSEWRSYTSLWLGTLGTRARWTRLVHTFSCVLCTFSLCESCISK